MHAEAADLLEKIRNGEWSDEIQEALRNAVAGFADDFGYDLDEEGQPLTDEVGGTTREQEGMRRRDTGDEGEGEAAPSERAEQQEEQEAAATA
jgi:F-type H+-transporting ATPase subunit alpha